MRHESRPIAEIDEDPPQGLPRGAPQGPRLRYQ
jgi:hypothetical protein